MPDRTIKFKFWNPPAKAFVEQYKYSGYVDELFDQDDMLIPCQYTGMQDIKGKEVYENDLVKINKCNPEEILTGKVTFKHGAFCVELINSLDTFNFVFMHQIGPFEIIGSSLEREKNK